MIKADQADQLIKSKLTPARYKHSCNVADVAKELARQFKVNEEFAYIAGLLHDYAKGLSGDVLLKIAVENRLIDDDIEYLIPDILHAKVGAFLLSQENLVKEPEILNAIAFHTLGDENMSDLDKIIFLADMIEPGRDYPGQERLQCLAGRNLDEAMLFGLESTIKYCIEKGRLLHPQTIAVRNMFLKINSGILGGC